MTHLLEALVCLAIAGALYVILRDCLQSGVISGTVWPKITRRNWPWLFQASIIFQYAMIVAAVAGALWCLFLQGAS